MGSGRWRNAVQSARRAGDCLMPTVRIRSHIDELSAQDRPLPGSRVGTGGPVALSGPVDIHEADCPFLGRCAMRRPAERNGQDCSMSEHEELLRIQDPAAASEWMEAEVQRWRSRVPEHHQSYTDAALSDYHGFRHLPADAWFNRVLAFGGGDGQEILLVLDAMKERASAPGGCWKVQSIRLHQAREAHNDGSIRRQAGRRDGLAPAA